MFNTNNLNGALYTLYSHINHSCLPNSRAIDTWGRLGELSGMLSFDGVNSVIAGEKEIGEGEEVTVSYVDVSSQGELRRDHLKKDYGFMCHCPRCAQEESKDKEIKTRKDGNDGKVLEEIEEGENQQPQTHE